jgi:hypothetical protein
MENVKHKIITQARAAFRHLSIQRRVLGCIVGMGVPDNIILAPENLNIVIHAFSHLPFPQILYINLPIFQILYIKSIPVQRVPGIPPSTLKFPILLVAAAEPFPQIVFPRTDMLHLREQFIKKCFPRAALDPIFKLPLEDLPPLVLFPDHSLPIRLVIRVLSNVKMVIAHIQFPYPIFLLGQFLMKANHSVFLPQTFTEQLAHEVIPLTVALCESILEPAMILFAAI